MDPQTLMSEIIRQYGLSAAITIFFLVGFLTLVFNRLFDRLNQKEQASLDTKTHITKAQFDVEYEAYRKIWD